MLILARCSLYIILYGCCLCLYFFWGVIGVFRRTSLFIIYFLGGNWCISEVRLFKLGEFCVLKYFIDWFGLFGRIIHSVKYSGSVFSEAIGLSRVVG